MFPPSPERAFFSANQYYTYTIFRILIFFPFFRKMSTGPRSPQNILVCHAALSLILDLSAFLQKQSLGTYSETCFAVLPNSHVGSKFLIFTEVKLSLWQANNVTVSIVTPKIFFLREKSFFLFLSFPNFENASCRYKQPSTLQWIQALINSLPLNLAIDTAS